MGYPEFGVRYDPQKNKTVVNKANKVTQKPNKVYCDVHKEFFNYRFKECISKEVVLNKNDPKDSNKDSTKPSTPKEPQEKKKSSHNHFSGARNIIC